MTKEGELLYVTAEGKEVYSTERNPENTKQAIEDKKRREGLDSMGNKPVADPVFSRPFVKPDSYGSTSENAVPKKSAKNNVLDFPTSDDNNQTMSQAA